MSPPRQLPARPSSAGSRRIMHSHSALRPHSDVAAAGTRETRRLTPGEKFACYQRAKRPENTFADPSSDPYWSPLGRHGGSGSERRLVDEAAHAAVDSLMQRLLEREARERPQRPPIAVTPSLEAGLCRRHVE